VLGALAAMVLIRAKASGALEPFRMNYERRKQRNGPAKAG